jgi:ATP-dependent DNA helicase RecG
LNGPINSPLSGPINELAKLFEIISSKEGINRIELIAQTEKGRTTINRYLTVLKDCSLIEYIGARKTGGYYLTDKAKDKLK